MSERSIWHCGLAGSDEGGHRASSAAARRQRRAGASSLVELAVQRLGNEILRGALVPGERLIEEQFTRWFGGTGRAPLREVAGSLCNADVTITTIG